MRAAALDVAPADAYGVATFYALFSTTPRAPRVVHVCDDIACICAGAESLCATLESTFGPPGTPGSDGTTTWLRSPCLGLCDRAPAVLVTAAGNPPAARALAPVTAHRLASLIASDSHAGEPPAAPHVGGSELRLLRRVGKVDPESLDDYRAHDGYHALREAFELGPQGVIAEVQASNLLGRGGAAFPTGRKMEAVASAPARPHYLICNADESEPGTFKDRILMERDPFAIVEAMTIAGFATGCEQGYIYIRGEYPLAAQRIGHAIDEARKHGLLGRRRDGARHALRYRDPPRRRRVYLRRRDGALQLDRGQARRAAQQAAVSRRGGPLRKTDAREQRRDARESAGDPARRRQRLRAHRNAGFDRNAALLSLRRDRASRLV